MTAIRLIGEQLAHAFKRLADIIVAGIWGPVRAAERRWRQRNARAKAAGCPCGAPNTRVRVYRGNVGRVPMEQWGCDEHYDADGWMGYELPNGDFLRLFSWNRRTPCDDCSETGGERGCHGWGGQLGGLTEYWSCPVRPELQYRYGLADWE